MDIQGRLAKWDLFISHASEDKELFVRSLAIKLHDLGMKIWYDEFTLKVGDSLSHSINRGLIDSDFGVVVLSKNFFAKKWPQRELAALETKTIHTRSKVILPVWYDISADEIAHYSLTLADTFALTSKDEIGSIALKLKEQILGRKKVRAKPLQEIFESEIEHASGLLEYLESFGNQEKGRYPEYADQLAKFKSQLASTDIDVIYENRIELTKLTIKLEQNIDEEEASIQWDIAMADMDSRLGK